MPDPRQAGTVLPNWLRQRALVTPSRLALVVPSESGAVQTKLSDSGPQVEARLTFAELDRRVDRIVGALAALGVGTGDRVALLLRNGQHYVELVHAFMRLGAVLVPLNVRLTAPELCWQLDDADVSLLVYDAYHASLAGTVGAERPSLPRRAISHLEQVANDRVPGSASEAIQSRQRHFSHAAADNQTSADDHTSRDSSRAAIAHPNESEPARVTRSGDSPLEYLDLTAVHSIIYTSGTTGRPKGALLTYGNHWWSAVGSALNLGNRHDDRWLACLPLFHVGGLSILIRSVIYGIPAIVHPSFDARAVNDGIDTEEVTIVSVVATALQRMLEERGSRPYPATLRCVLLGGGPAPRPLLEECARRSVPVVQTYGLTETASQVATLAPEDSLRKLGSAGKPLMPTELRVELVGRPTAVGQIGEILVRGPTVTPGYVNQPEATDQAFRDGWFRTGDLGYLDDEGYLYVVDRRDDLIISGGENVYPGEVEAVILAHPAVDEVGVVGVPSAEWGQVPIAAVRLRPGVSATADDIAAHCRERLAGYKVPTRFYFVPSLPRTAAGKLQRHKLRRDLSIGGS